MGEEKQEELRDRFAMVAMDALLKNSLEESRYLEQEFGEDEAVSLADALKRIPRVSYLYADAMMKERKKEEDNEV